MVKQPTGTVTFLFTDIENSTQLWERHPKAMQVALAQHDALLRKAIETHGGHIFKTVGDAFCAAFATASDALAAALAAQRALHAQAWGETPIKVRMGLHTGVAEERANDYFGPTVNRVARLHSVGHGGQILLSYVTQELVRGQLPEQVKLHDMGVRRLENLIRPEHIFQVIAPDLLVDFPPLKTLDYRPNNLPMQTTSFIGREKELAEVRDTLLRPEVRLLTLTGPGGMGKTRLGLQVAANMLDDFEHGVFFVALAPVGSPDHVIPTIAQALGVRVIQGRPLQERLKDYLCSKQMLLLLDNLEHVAAAAQEVVDLLTAAAGLKVLVTSRVSLRVYGGYDYPVPPLLTLPDPKRPPPFKELTQYAAMQLFIERARAAQADFIITNDNALAVAEICCQLGGSPLAIELAAAWVEILTPPEILAEIDQSLDFLETDLRDVPERQRNIRAVFDYSWNLLTEQEQEVFQALSVFRGGFTRPAAQHIAGASLRALRALANKSLLQHTPAGRYEVHELLRQYAAEKLASSPVSSEAAYDRHSAYYTALLQQWAADLKGAGQQTALAEMDVEIENSRAAWNWAVEQGKIERLDKAIESLCRYYEWRGRYQEGEAVCQIAAEKLAAVAPDGDGLRVWAKTLAWQSEFSQALGCTKLADRLLRQSLTLLERPELANQNIQPEKAFVLMLMGWLAFGSNREQAKQLFEQSLTLYRVIGDRWGTANALRALGVVAMNLGTYDEAKRLLETNLEIRRSLGDQRGVADTLMSLSVIAISQGQLEESERLARESNEILQEMGDLADIADGLFILGGTLLWLGKFDEGHSLLEGSIAIYNDLGSHNASILPNTLLGVAKVHLGQYRQARTQGQTSLTLSQKIGNQREAGLSLFVLGSVVLAEEAYAGAQELLQESVAAYREIGQWSALSFALTVLGISAIRLGQLVQARQYLAEALGTATEIEAFIPLMYALPAIALLLADQGEPERAVEMYALASHYPFVVNSRWFEDVAGRHIAAVATTLPPEVAIAAQERGRARDLGATVKDLLTELGR